MAIVHPVLNPYSLASLERARQYLKRPDSVVSDTEEEVIILGLNAIPGLFEGEVGRKLACRTYRNAVTISCTATVNTTTLTAASGLLALKTLDDAVGVNLAIGSRVASITSDTALGLTKQAGASGAASVTFGSEPLVVDGTGTQEVYLPARPVVEVYRVKSVDGLGVKTALDLTSSRLDKKTGRLVLMSDVFPRGSLNIEIEAKAGYREPTTTDRGDWEGWSRLEGLCLRAVAVMFQDFDTMAGRTGELSLATATMKIMDFKLPEDIREGLRQFAQPW